MKYQNKLLRLHLACLLAGIYLFSFKAFCQEKITEFQLESAIVGDKEQPAVSHFIPWQGTSAPDKLQWDLDVKYDKTLDIIDREVMVRSLNIYEEMKMEPLSSVE